SLPAASREPSGLKATQVPPGATLKTWRTLAVSASQMATFPSDVVANRLPLGSNATPLTQLECNFLNACTSVPSSISQTCTIQLEALARRRLPVGPKARLVTSSG